MLSIFQTSKVLPSSVATLASRCLSTSISLSNKKIAVVLSGCGVYDGSEIHESAACLAAITRNNAEPVIFAPKIQQAHVIDHTKGEPLDHVRCVFVESARIARGEIRSLVELDSKDFSAVVFPGGFGAAKNLSNFAFEGANLTINTDVEKVLRDFHKAGKPIALCCIAPILAAKVFGSEGVQITLGKKGDESKWPYGGAIDAASSLGAKVEEKSVNEVCIDSKNLIVTTPAFMFNGKFHEIQDGIQKMIDELIKLS